MRCSLLMLTALSTLALQVFMATPLGVAKLVEDLNEDGLVDIIDVELAVAAYGSRRGDSHWNPNADVIVNGLVDVYDVVKIIMALGKSLPVASFTESAHTAPAGTPIDFYANESNDPGGVIVLYEWDWETDGTYDYNTTSPNEVSHTYERPGIYNVTLRVTDNDGLTDTVTATKTITFVNVVPEIPLGTIGVSATILVALIVYFKYPRSRKIQTIGK